MIVLFQDVRLAQGPPGSFEAVLEKGRELPVDSAQSSVALLAIDGQSFPSLSTQGGGVRHARLGGHFSFDGRLLRPMGKWYFQTGHLRYQ